MIPGDIRQWYYIANPCPDGHCRCTPHYRSTNWNGIKLRNYGTILSQPRPVPGEQPSGVLKCATQSLDVRNRGRRRGGSDQDKCQIGRMLWAAIETKKRQLCHVFTFLMMVTNVQTNGRWRKYGHNDSHCSIHVAWAYLGYRGTYECNFYGRLKMVPFFPIFQFYEANSNGITVRNGSYHPSHQLLKDKKKKVI